MSKISHDSETLAQGQQVITACAFIHHEFDGKPKVFLLKRAPTKKFLPGVFELPGGHIDFGETLEEGLKREIKEEIQMDCAIGDPFAAFTYLNEIKGSHAIEVIYFAQLVGPLEGITIHPEDHSEYGWFAEDELYQTRSERQGEDDIELGIIQKGFALLRGEALKV